MSEENKNGKRNLYPKKIKASEYIKKNYSKAWQIIFVEMARRVGKSLDDLELDLVDAYKGTYQWCYDAHRWSLVEEEAFRDWLLKFMFENRGKLGLGNVGRKYIRKHIIPYFLLQYSWRYND